LIIWKVIPHLKLKIRSRAIIDHLRFFILIKNSFPNIILNLDEISLFE